MIVHNVCVFCVKVTREDVSAAVVESHNFFGPHGPFEEGLAIVRWC